MKTIFRMIYILLLAAPILLGSVDNIHAGLASPESQTEEASKELEDFSAPIIPHPMSFLTTFIFLVIDTYVSLFDRRLYFISNVPQLLCANRIALPPPSLT